MTAMKPYVKQGRRARLAGTSRDACPFKREDLIVDWLAGWDQVDREVAEEQRQAAKPRWQDSTNRTRDSYGSPASSWTLQGQAPRIDAMAAAMYHGEPLGPRLTAYAWGIERAPMLPDADLSSPEAVQRAAIQAVRQILRDRLAEPDAIADETGARRIQADEQDGAK